MDNLLFQTQIKPKEHFLPAEMNIISLKNERIDKIH